jgi:hypothetical protein
VVVTPGTLLEAEAVVGATGALGTLAGGLVASAVETPGVGAGAGVDDGVVPPSKEGLPWWICQLFHSMSRENEKIMSKMVRRISILA